MTFFTEMISAASFIALVFLFLGLTDVEEKPAEMRALMRAAPVGVLLALAMLFANGLIEGRSGWNYVIDFLLLKKVGDWLFRTVAGISYIFIGTGLGSMLAFTLRRLIRKEKQ